jgi:hypothetical protein
MLIPNDDEDDCSDTMTRSTTRKTVRGFLKDLAFNYGLFRTFGNARGQSAVKAYRMWRGETVYIMPQRSALHRSIR